MLRKCGDILTFGKDSNEYELHSRINYKQIKISGCFLPFCSQVAGKWRGLYIGSSLRRMRWEDHVARMGERRNAYTILVGKSEGRYHSKDLAVDGRIIIQFANMFE
jgi:hypothetical protein